jgi:hypothetical protein
MGVGPLSERGIPPPPQKGYHRLERTTEPCIVGFDVSGDASCPLYQSEPTIERLGAFLEMAARVVRRRRRRFGAAPSNPLKPVAMARGAIVMLTQEKGAARTEYATVKTTSSGARSKKVKYSQ